MRIKIFILVLICGIFPGFGQPAYYAEPLKIPLSLTGNFGEFRPDHFHTGLDFRTRQQSGIAVYAIAPGYISRIVVSPTGYGKALYIDHPNGTTSVYGHLSKFREDMEKFVKSEQYRRESFAVNLFLPAGKFLVEKQDMIGFSGNSGSSGGPHLHFEIRDSETQDALNPLLIQNFNITDKIPPAMDAIRLYPLSDRSHVDETALKKSWPVKFSGSGYQISPPATIRAYGEIGIAIKANDFSETGGRPCGIYTSRLIVDGKEVFSSSVGRIPFGQNRYMNSHIDYEEFVKTGKYYQRLWREKGNRFYLARTGRDRGILKIDSGKVYSCEIHLSDETGNQSKLVFSINGKYAENPSEKTSPERLFRHDAVNRVETGEFQMITQSGAFYEDFPFTWSVSKPSAGYYSGIYKIHNSSTPIHKAIKVRLLTTGLPSSLFDKAFIVEMKADGKKMYAGGKMHDGWMEAELTGFGDYAVVCDTIPPKIVPLGIKNNALTETNRIRFNISDEDSGIRSYKGLIDDQWALFEWDPKTRSLVYIIDPERITLGKRHSLELTVSDRVNNTAVYRATFWK